MKTHCRRAYRADGEAIKFTLDHDPTRAPLIAPVVDTQSVSTSVCFKIEQRERGAHLHTYGQCFQQTVTFTNMQALLFQLLHGCWDCTPGGILHWQQPKASLKQ
jgi:hypothetical protein